MNTKFIQIPKDPRYPDSNRPHMTNQMKADHIGEHSWTEDCPYYDEDGVLHEDHEVTHTVPWDLTKKIFREMLATAALNRPAFEGEEEELYYLQDNRSYVGNDILFWAKDGKGYTTDVSKAHLFTKEEAISQNQCRDTDIPWQKSYIDGKTRPAVDMQCVKIIEALNGTGIVLHKEPPPPKEVFNCSECGSFMSEHQYWGGECPKCGAHSRP